MITELTKVYATDDGRIFKDRADAEAHEYRTAMLRGINQAYANSHFTKYGECRPGTQTFKERLVQELFDAGFRMTEAAG